jgi:prepilin-type N-terminal cleavage/methylation domain-containing protein
LLIQQSRNTGAGENVMFMLRKNSGFTLAELMVVLGIIAIISAFAIPGGSASRNVMSAIEGARMRAVRDRVSVGIVFTDATTYSVWIDNGAGAGTADDAVCHADERIIRNGVMPAGITITAATFGGPNSFRFDSQGFPISTGGNPTGGTVTVTNTRDVRLINLSLAGNGSISKP